MRNEAWVDGMEELLASFPSQDQDEGVLTKRGEVYRRALGSLSDEVWLYAVRESIKTERWFPTVAVLLDYAGRAPVMAPRAALPDDTRTAEEKRADAARMLDAIKAAVIEREKDLPPTPIATAPRGDTVVDKDAASERIDELRRQARQLGVPETPDTPLEGRA